MDLGPSASVCHSSNDGALHYDLKAVQPHFTGNVVRVRLRWDEFQDAQRGFGLSSCGRRFNHCHAPRTRRAHPVAAKSWATTAVRWRMKTEGRDGYRSVRRPFPGAVATSALGRARCLQRVVCATSGRLPFSGHSLNARYSEQFPVLRAWSRRFDAAASTNADHRRRYRPPGRNVA